MLDQTPTQPADDHATALALDIGGDDMGAAWLIARRSPGLTRNQVANAAKTEGLRDTFGRRRMIDGEAGDQYLDRTARRELDRQSAITASAELSPDLRSLAADCADYLGDLAESLAAEFTQAESAELCGTSLRTVERRVSDLRTIKARRIAETLRWREWR